MPRKWKMGLFHLPLTLPGVVEGVEAGNKQIDDDGEIESDAPPKRNVMAEPAEHRVGWNQAEHSNEWQENLHNGQMDTKVDGSMNEWINGWMQVNMEKWMVTHMQGQTSVWIDVIKDG